MLQYYLAFWKQYADFRGRGRRAAFWYAMLMNLIISAALFLLTPLVPMLLFVSWGYDLITVIPCVSLGVRRLHDIGRSGWWWLLVFVPLIGAIMLIYWFVQEGDRFQNDYGPDPKAGEPLRKG